MKKRTRSVLGAALLVFAAAPHLATAAEVQTDLFSITLGAGFGEFAKQAHTSNAAAGKIETTNWVSKAPTGEAVIVTVSKMPGKILNPDKLIASTRDSLLKSLKATLESDTAERLMFRSDSAFFRSRFVVKGDRFYQLLYVGRSAEQRALPAVGNLFESFHIIAPPAVASSR